MSEGNRCNRGVIVVVIVVVIELYTRVTDQRTHDVGYAVIWNELR